MASLDLRSVAASYKAGEPGSSACEAAIAGASGLPTAGKVDVPLLGAAGMSIC
jgi:hypothetical protein